MVKWEMVKMGEISTIQGGYAYKSTQFIKNSVPIIRIGNLNGDTVDLDYDICYPQDFWNKNEVYRVKMGDILIAMSGATVGKIGRYIYNEPALLNQRVGLIRINENRFFSNYIYQYVKSSFFLGQIQQLSFGCAQPNISAKHIENISIPLPPLGTQKQIAKTLDTAAELLAMRKQQLVELDNLIKSTFYDMFGDPVTNEKGWEVSTIDKVCSKIMGGGTPSKSHSEYYIGIIPWVTPKDMKTIWINDSIDHISEDAIINSSAKLIPSNSVLMVIRSGILKRSLPVAINTVDIAINQDMKAFITNEKVVAEYLLYFFMLMQNNILKNVRAVTADNIEFGLIKNLTIPLPPIPLQTQFAEIVTKIEEQKALVKKAIDETQYLFNSLMSEYFE